MHVLQIQLRISDIIVLLLMATVLGFVVQFVLVNRRRLQAMIEESKKQNSLTGSGGRYPEDMPKTKWVTPRKAALAETPRFATASRSYQSEAITTAVVPDVVQDLKQTIRQQQKTLDQLLHRVDKLDALEEKELGKPTTTATVAVQVLEEKEAELQKTKHQLSAAQKVAGRVTQVYEEFDLLQQKMAELEESANKAADLAMELDDVQQAYDQVKKDLDRKQEKLHEAVTENGQLHQQLAETEDKLNETNLQRQQLQKKVQLLENINTELLQLSEANKKMKNELRRIAELESMLSLVSDERDLLLKKRLS